MKDRIFLFDLDDTLIDTKFRQYKVVCDFLLTEEISDLPLFSDYCAVRKNENATNKDLIARWVKDDNALFRFERFWKQNIESLEYLSFDTINFSLADLIEFKEGNDLLLGIVSLRSNLENALSQFDSLGLTDLFVSVNFLSHKKFCNPKSEILAGLKKRYEVKGFVGDALSDFEAAQDNEIHFYPVSSGIYKFFNEEKKITQILKIKI